MKKVFFFIGSVFFFAIGFGSVIGVRMLRKKSFSTPLSTITPTPAFTPVQTDLELQPPRQSLTGKVIRVTGGAIKKPRNGDDTMILKVDTPILEDELITASESGSFDIRFATNDLMSLSPDTALAFASTNPENFLFRLNKGTVVFETDEQIATISARALNSLFSLTNGKAELALDPDERIIVFMLAEGQGQMGYIDKENMTQTVEVSAGETLMYDDGKRTVRKN